jgi:hypothetical protein
MNIEQLIKGQEALKQIKEIEKHIEVLENGYCNSILGWDYLHNRDGERVTFNLDGELRDMVIQYKKTQLKKLNDEFKNL